MNQFQSVRHRSLRQQPPLWSTMDKNMEKNDDISDLTRKIFSTIDSRADTGGAGGSSSLQGLINIDKMWKNLKSGGWASPPEKVVHDMGSQVMPDDLPAAQNFDVAIVGGTLGIFFALSLQRAGFKTCIVERGKVAGRLQEWNLSKKELLVLVRLGLLTEEEMERVINIEFNPVRVGFRTDTTKPLNSAGTSSSSSREFETYVRDILNLGVSPAALISLMKEKYERGGGVIIEQTALLRVDVYDNAAKLSLKTLNTDKNIPPPPTSSSTPSSTPPRLQVSARLVLDAMGNQSPIARQMRGPIEPDGVCLVVGSCASGYDTANNTYSDLIYCNSPITSIQTNQNVPHDMKSGAAAAAAAEATSDSKLQFYWEAFPSGSGKSDRTTYLFSYMDSTVQRPSLSNMLDKYWELLPQYQGKNIDDLTFQRILYGCFPTYRDSPLKPTFNRILQVGDASGVQSPLSFGGFGSLTRHLERVVGALEEALNGNLLSSQDLSLINAYQPNLSCAWFFQRTMSVPIGENPRPDLIIGTLSNSFSSMETLGDAVMRPFLQDVLMFIPLIRTLTKAAFNDPLTPFKIIPHVGIAPFTDFLYHFFFLGLYTFLHHNVSPILLDIAPNLDSKKTSFFLKRTCEKWKYGAGLDYFD